jgi:hypothetical protein
VLVLELTSNLYLGVPAPWSLRGLSISLRPFVRGTRRLLLHGKLRSAGGIKVTGRFSVSLSGRAFVASQEVPRKRYCDRYAILFVSASIMWTRDIFVESTNTTNKLSCREFASHHPFLYVSAFNTCNLCVFIFLVQYIVRISYRL